MASIDKAPCAAQLCDTCLRADECYDVSDESCPFYIDREYFRKGLAPVDDEEALAAFREEFYEYLDTFYSEQ